MQRAIVAVISTAALVSFATACTESSKPLSPTPPATAATLPADGTTLKVSAPGVQSPTSDFKLQSPTNPTLTASAATAAFASGVALQYRFQVFDAAGAMVEEAVVDGTSWQPTATLVDNQRYTWRVRAEHQGAAGPWSGTGSFVTQDPAIINDPLTDGKTVGKQVGGVFIPGQGWQSLALTHGIDYDIPTCTDCRLSFDLTNIGKAEGFTHLKDLKFISMGDAPTFGDFTAFRNHPWKMHLEQRSDGNGTGMKITWRNGRADEHGEPGDHTNKVDPAVDWRSSEVFHFDIEWSPRGFSIFVNGTEWLQDGFGGNAYAPPAHRISLGCYPRADSFVGAIYRNVKVVKR